MRKKLLVATLIAVAMAFALGGTALAAPAITAFGKTSGIDINYPSQQTARVYMVTSTGGTWVVIDVLSSRGVVRRLYSGAGASASTRLWTGPWNGTDARGKYLPTGNYVYRITVTKGGHASTARGVIRVCTKIVGNGMIFPLRGRFTWADRFGAPRSGRTHQGQDLMAANGTPVVACVSGYVSSKVGKSAGNWISLKGSKYTMWYMHLSRFAVRSGNVKAGQVIGYVGCTGNAGAGNYHLHFEIHPGGGAAVDPRPYLLGMRR